MTDNSNIPIIKVSDYTSLPGARYIKDGDGSAEKFYEEYFKPVTIKYSKLKKPVKLDFDGTWGYASSFISELALRIAKDFDSSFIDTNLLLKSEDEPTLVKRFQNQLRKDYGERKSS